MSQENIKLLTQTFCTDFRLTEFWNFEYLIHSMNSKLLKSKLRKNKENGHLFFSYFYHLYTLSLTSILKSGRGLRKFEFQRKCTM